MSSVAWRKANREKKREYDAVRYKADPEKHCARNRARYRANPEKHNKLTASWHKAHLEKRRAYSQQRRALLMGAPGPGLVAVEAYWQSIKHLPCVCGHTGKMTLDHIIPLSKGGHHAPYNIQGLCLTCNKSKGVKDFKEWLDSRHSDKWPQTSQQSPGEIFKT